MNRIKAAATVGKKLAICANHLRLERLKPFGGHVYYLDYFVASVSEQGLVRMGGEFPRHAYRMCSRARGIVNRLPIDQRSKHYSRITSRQNTLRALIASKEDR